MNAQVPPQSPSPSQSQQTNQITPACCNCGGGDGNSTVDLNNCCKIQGSRTRWVSSLLPIIHTDPIQADCRFPWWGLYRTPDSAPLPRVYYPPQIEPLSTFLPAYDWPSDQQQEKIFIPDLNPNWALTK